MKILLATDGSDTARAAADFLVRFPFPQGSEVTLLNVIRDAFFKYEEWEEWEGLDDEHRDELAETQKLVTKEREDFVAREAERLRSVGWTCATEVRTGQPANEIVSAAGSLGAHLVVIGSVGRSGLREFHLGRVCNAVLEYAPHSVLVVKPPTGDGVSPGVEQHPPLRILVAFDGSKSSRKGVEFCHSLPLNERSEIHVLGVLRLMHGYRQDIQQRLTRVWHQKKAAAQTALDQIVEQGSWPTPHVSAQLRESSSVTEAILDVAKEHGSDLIVMGNKGKGSIESFLLGSVTRRIMRHAPCSVLAVRT